MSDISNVLPAFDLKPFTNILHNLEKAGVGINDILTNQPIDIARRAQIPLAHVSKLQAALIAALHEHLDAEKSNNPAWTCISLLDDHLDRALGGGIPLGYLTEITGESGVGKSQFLLTLLLSVQLLGKSALYISTEAALSTARLSQLIDSHPSLVTLPAESRPSLSRIHTIQVLDLEAQDQILKFQVPIAVERMDIGLLVIDSIASNYRAEFEQGGGGSGAAAAGSGPKLSAGKLMAERKKSLTQLGAFLQNLADKHQIAIVCANQVADRFEPLPLTQPENLALSLSHQQRWFTGWGDLPFNPAVGTLKTPSLGLVWTNQISARIALIKESTNVERKQRRWLRIVFASWVNQTFGLGVEYEITSQGLVAKTSDIH